MALRYYKNQYYLSNEGISSTTYTVAPADNCCTCEELPEPTTYTLNAGQEVLLPLSVDGEYIVKVPATATEPTYTISYFPNLEKRLIRDVKIFLCGDDCMGCPTNNAVRYDNYIQYQTIFNEVLSYHLLATYNSQDSDCVNCKNNLFVHRAAKLYQCDILKELCTQFYNHDFFNKETGIELFKKLIAIYYLSFYFDKYFSAIDSSEIEYVDKLYYLCEIKSCIRKLGLDFEELKNLYTQINNTNCSCIEIENLPPTSASIVSAPIIRGLDPVVIPGNDFLENYSDPEGDILHSIKIKAYDTTQGSLAAIKLYSEGVELQVGDTVSIYSIMSGLLTAGIVELPNETVTVEITYTAIDAGSLQEGAQGKIILTYIKL